MKYMCRVCAEPAVGEPTDEERAHIANTDSRWHNKTFTTEAHAQWTAVMEKRGYRSGWLVAREQGLVKAHIWYALKDKVATVLNVQACAYGASKIQVAAMLLEAEDLFEQLGATTVCYLDEMTGTYYDEAFDALGYTKCGYDDQPLGAVKWPGNSDKAVRWRNLAEDRDQRADRCLDQSLNTRYLSGPVSPSDSSGTS
jgi:hypothetical protein